ncbi:MAG: D-lyxose/D-mannose family sugar isomerase [Phycisphaerales bacterium]|nr:D-lyxose/D-mannose family sugar isomerase [Phycisphaerales bacterium]
MDINIQQCLQEAKELLVKSGFPVTPEEVAELAVNDFGLGDIRKEGFAFIDILRSPRLRITLLILLPNQTLPQHMHPSYDNEQGKEETIRVLYGMTKVYVAGNATKDIAIPKAKESYYTAKQEVALNVGQQYSVQPGTEHWFQAGPQGSVNICFQNRVDETKNIFSDPASQGCPIKAY